MELFDDIIKYIFENYCMKKVKIFAITNKKHNKMMNDLKPTSSIECFLNKFTLYKIYTKIDFRENELFVKSFKFKTKIILNSLLLKKSNDFHCLYIDKLNINFNKEWKLIDYFNNIENKSKNIILNLKTDFFLCHLVIYKDFFVISIRPSLIINL